LNVNRDHKREGVGRDSVRVSLVLIQSIYRRAVEWGRLTANPAKAVRKPSGRRERTILARRGIGSLKRLLTEDA
jgi:site-specific recombinase XerC